MDHRTTTARHGSRPRFSIAPGDHESPHLLPPSSPQHHPLSKKRKCLSADAADESTTSTPLSSVAPPPPLAILRTAVPIPPPVVAPPPLHRCFSSSSLRQAGAGKDVDSDMEDVVEALQEELEEERKASATAVSEAMAMIARLQEEKSSLDMTARQYRMVAEQREAHDAEIIAALKDRLSQEKMRASFASRSSKQLRLPTIEHAQNPASEPEPADEESAQEKCVISLIGSSNDGLTTEYYNDDDDDDNISNLSLKPRFQVRNEDGYPFDISYPTSEEGYQFAGHSSEDIDEEDEDEEEEEELDPNNDDHSGNLSYPSSKEDDNNNIRSFHSSHHHNNNNNKNNHEAGFPYSSSFERGLGSSTRYPSISDLNIESKKPESPHPSNNGRLSGNNNNIPIPDATSSPRDLVWERINELEERVRHLSQPQAQALPENSVAPAFSTSPAQSGSSKKQCRETSERSYQSPFLEEMGDTFDVKREANGASCSKEAEENMQGFSERSKWSPSSARAKMNGKRAQTGDEEEPISMRLVALEAERERMMQEIDSLRKVNHELKNVQDLVVQSTPEMIDRDPRESQTSHIARVIPAPKEGSLLLILIKAALSFIGLHQQRKWGSTPPPRYTKLTHDRNNMLYSRRMYYKTPIMKNNNKWSFNIAVSANIKLG